MFVFVCVMFVSVRMSVGLGVVGCLLMSVALYSQTERAVLIADFLGAGDYGCMCKTAFIISLLIQWLGTPFMFCFVWLVVLRL